MTGIRICFTLVFAGALTAQTPRLDTTTFVVMGEGLAAGMANYGLSSTVQSGSFPARIAAQMQTAFPQPLMQPPGIGDVVGFPRQEVRMPIYPQGTVRVFAPQPNPNDNAPTLFVLNLSVPGFTLADSLTLRPQEPIVQRDMKQTVTNMILGFPQLFFQRKVPLWTQFEYARAMLPTMALIELGYYEALDAAVNADPARIPDPAAFGASYSTVLAGLRGLQAQVIATTIPNPLDTAYFSTPESAAALYNIAPADFRSALQLNPGDLLTRDALTTVGLQFATRKFAALPKGAVLTAAGANEITARVNALNAQIATVARSNGAVVYDLNAFLRRVRVSGAIAGNRSLTADYLGGFYSLDGVYPGSTGHALIANDILLFLNQTYRTSFPQVGLNPIVAADATLGGVRIPAARSGQ